MGPTKLARLYYKASELSNDRCRHNTWSAAGAGDGGVQPRTFAVLETKGTPVGGWMARMRLRAGGGCAKIGGSVAHPLRAQGFRAVDAGGADFLTALAQVLSLRVLIARAGEQDSLAWWESYALTEHGRWALGRLYPRHAAYAGAQLAIEAAIIVHREAIGRRPAVTLFGLGVDLDAQVMRQLELRRMDGEPLTIPPPIRSADELRAQLNQVAPLTDEDLAAVNSAAVNGHLVELGAVPGRGLETAEALQTVTRRLAAAYTRSEYGRLIVPYYRLEA